MLNHLPLYHKVKERFRQWLPKERITRIRNMTLLVVGLYQSKAIHLSKIVRTWPLGGKDPSLVNRLWRFLDNPRVDVRDWYHPLAEQIVQSFAGRRMFIPVDTTKVGFNHRLLTIGVAFKKRVLPLAWSVERGEKGHTSQGTQIGLFRYVARLLPKSTNVWVLGDTEFQSLALLRWIRKQGWNFVMRVRGHVKVRGSGQSWVKINELAIQEGQTRYMGWVRVTQEHDAGWYWLILHWEEGEDEPWYLLSNRSGKRRLINYYRRRMWTEELYADVKGHGFDLEATHLKDSERINRLVLAVFIAFVWLITLGSWVVKRGYRHYIDHKSRRDKSYFRLGWDWVARCFRLNQPVRVRFVPYF